MDAPFASFSGKNLIGDVLRPDRTLAERAGGGGTNVTCMGTNAHIGGMGNGAHAGPSRRNVTRTAPGKPRPQGGSLGTYVLREHERA